MEQSIISFMYLVTCLIPPNAICVYHSLVNMFIQQTEDTVRRAEEEKVQGKLVGHKEMSDFVASIQKPRAVIILVQAGKPVDDCIASLLQHLEAGDIIIDGGNEWYLNTQRRQAEAAKHVSSPWSSRHEHIA